MKGLPRKLAKKKRGAIKEEDLGSYSTAKRARLSSVFPDRRQSFLKL